MGTGEVSSMYLLDDTQQMKLALLWKPSGESCSEEAWMTKPSIDSKANFYRDVARL